MVMGLVLLMIGGWGFLRYRNSPNRGLPYSDSFAHGRADEWKALGGTWELINGSMRNDSDERGAKLLTGSSRWSNVSVDADVMLLGSGGDAGLILRSSEEEQGVDAYTGYYAGLRAIDNSLVLGRAGHGWTEVLNRLDPEQLPVRPFHWFHMRLLAYGCEVAATVTVPPQTVPTTIAVTDSDCVQSGRMGLRSYASGGAWRNVVVRSSTQEGLAAMLATLPSRKSQSSTRSPAEPNQYWDFYGSAFKAGSHSLPSSPNAQPISSLRLTALTASVPATVRGIVILASPALFVQDSTGGISVQQIKSQSLKVGDEVEATGIVSGNAFSAALDQATVRVLWEGMPMPAVSVTASQAATGAFDATFIEVEGRLVGKQYGPDDTLLFDLEAGPQSFRVIMNRGRGDSLYSKLKANSLLRVRGVAVADPTYTHDLVPFAVLLRSADDAVVVAGPPWWSAGRLLQMLVVSLLLAMVVIFFYHRIENWRLRAVLEERERLAFEMHDTLSQSFAGVGFQLEAIRHGMMNEQLPKLHQQLDLARELVRQSHEETRRSIAVLRPERPGAQGLLEGLTGCANYLVEGGSVRIVARSAGEAVHVPLRIVDTLYRIGQEALANAVSHGHPSTITIDVNYERNFIGLDVGDDGTGFTSSTELGGFGIRGMRKRAASMSASLEISSRPGNGTRVCVRAPVPARLGWRSWSAIFSQKVWRRIHHVADSAKFNPNSARR